jgi:pyridoxal phosphate enzyme (YggS family)
MAARPELREHSVDVASNLAAVRGRIAAAARAAGRDDGGVTLVAVTKTFGPEAISAALAAGQQTFGENRVQEADAKYPALKQSDRRLRLHLIGPLQTNKVRLVVQLFDVIETVDRPKLARALAKEMESQGRWPACLIQVNTGEEPQKAGVPPGEADALVALCRELALPVEGLMCIPPIDADPAPHFARLAELAARHGLAVLSMGMSADYELAIRMGATHVRIGTAIFGERPPPRPKG